MIEFSRSVLEWKDAHSTEFNKTTTHPMVHMLLIHRSLMGIREIYFLAQSVEFLGGRGQGAQFTPLKATSPPQFFGKSCFFPPEFFLQFVSRKILGKCVCVCDVSIDH